MRVARPFAPPPPPPTAVTVSWLTPAGAVNVPSWWKVWVVSAHVGERWPNGSVWTVLDQAGRLNAFAVLDSQIQTWRETAPGGSGPARWRCPAAPG